MKQFLFLILFFAFTLPTFSQNKTITRDTVNLRGVIFTSDGQPAPNISITSRQLDPRFKNHRIFTTSDDSGQFILNGIMPNDTLTIEAISYAELRYYNRGSRFMVIILPSKHTYTINSEKPIEITAARSIPKTTPTISYVPTNENPPSIISQMPEFPGGNERFLAFLKRTLSYPEKAVKNNIEGTVEIQFTVQKDGSLSDFIILNGIGYDCDQNVLNAIVNSPRWKPGAMNNAAIAINTSVAVKFSLTDK